MTRIKRILIISLILHIILLIWSNFQDKNNLIKYTDIDYFVFNDSINCLLHPYKTGCNLAEGPLNQYFGLGIGNVYSRETFRYTPFLSLLLLFNFKFFNFGKILFSIFDLIIGFLLFKLILLRSSPVPSSSSSTTSTTSTKAANYIAIIWLLNPIILNISTRGSSESILGILVISLLYLAEKKNWNYVAIIFGFSVHFKIYPIIYGSSLLASISNFNSITTSTSKVGGKKSGWISWNHIKFAMISFSTFMSLNLMMYSIWGQPFLQNTFLYHITRLDHRHNFSPYFYPFYLASSPISTSSSSLPVSISIWTKIIRNPLAAFIPQLGLSIITGFGLGGKDLVLAFFVQTFIFVSFNKVCTSQYFLWYLWLLPPLLPNLQISKRSGIILTLSWVLGQAIWLSQAYKLEMLGESNYLNVWRAGLLFFCINCGILCFVIGAYRPLVVSDDDAVTSGEDDCGKVKLN